MSDNKLSLVRFAELSGDLSEAIKRDKVNELLNMPPKDIWVKKHPIIKVKGKDGKLTASLYIPVRILKLLLTAIFQRWRYEITSTTQIANSVCVIVRLFYRDPLTGEWSWQDGVGAVPLQTDAGSDATDISSLKSHAVQIAAPAAASYAFKNACENIGRIFGSDLNNTNATDGFAGLYMNAGPQVDEKEETKTEDDLTTNY